MKAIIKYISLLLFSGLILPFYYKILQPVNTKPEIAALKKTGQKIPGELTAYEFSFFGDVVSNILPALKKLK